MSNEQSITGTELAFHNFFEARFRLDNLASCPVNRAILEKYCGENGLDASEAASLAIAYFACADQMVRNADLELLFFICYDDKGLAYGRGVVVADRGDEFVIRVFLPNGTLSSRLRIVKKAETEKWFFCFTKEELNEVVRRLQVHYSRIDCGTFGTKGKENGK